MGEGQVPKRVNRSMPSLAFFVVTDDIHRLGRMPVSVGIADRKGGHTS